jgi:glycosyltransferase involved in cell wall biosynthesis
MRIGFVMMETIYPQRGGVHEQIYLLLRELKKTEDAEIIAYSKRRVEEKGKKLLWLREMSPFFINKIVKNNYDVLISETAWAILPTLIASKLSRANCILHLHSIESKQDVGLSPMGRNVIRILEVFSDYCDKILVSSENDAKLLKKKATVFPNIIDVDAYQEKPKELKKPAVVFVGGMSYPPNREAAEFLIRVSNKIQQMGKNVNFYLVGPSPPEVSSPVYATGYVSSTIPYILGADVCVAPLKRGGGVKLKVLEYMGAGKPIIATRKAVEGIEKIKYINAENEDEFANAIIDVLGGKLDVNFEENKEIVMANHSPKSAVKRLLDVINELKMYNSKTYI